MTFAERHIIETYSTLFDGLSPLSKIELIESLTKSLKKDKIEKEDTFYNSFGTFSDDKTTEAIILEIKSSRKFRNREVNI